MQSLRSTPSIADLSPQQMDRHSGRPYSTTPDTAALTNITEQANELYRFVKPASLQLKGQDAYTKDIMTKMATGKATQAEQTAFHGRIQEARSSPAIKNLLQAEEEKSREPFMANAQSTHVETERPASEYPVPSCESASVYHRMDKLSLEDLEKQLAQAQVQARHRRELADAQNRCRLLEEMVTGVASSPKMPLNAQYKLSQDAFTKASCPKMNIQKATRQNAAKYTKPFCDFLTDNPTVFHAVAAMKKDLKDAGWTELSERDSWDIKPSGSYFVERNGSSVIAFTVGPNYKAGNGAAILAGHVDALTARLKPISTVPNKAGYLQLGVAPYAGGLNSTWWDRDLGIGGRVQIKQGDKIVTKLVKLDWPIAKIPTLAPHFGAPSQGPFNTETQMVPIIGLDSTPIAPFQAAEPFSQPSLLRGANGPIGSFVHTQPPALVKAIAEALDLNSSSIKNIVNWELELFDVQPATVGGLNKEFIYAGRIDDKLCSWAALQALIESQAADTDSSLIKVVGLFDDEEIGSLLRQGARGNFLPTVMERTVGSLAGHQPTSDLMGRTYANSFLVSSDVTHAVNPNFLNVYLENHAPHLNVGVAVGADPNGHMTTDSVSTAILQRCAEKADAKLQVFQIRNDSRSGGTVGPMLSSALGVRAIDAGLPQLSMHSIRATTGALDPGLGVITFGAFLNGFEAVDAEFR